MKRLATGSAAALALSCALLLGPQGFAAMHETEQGAIEEAQKRAVGKAAEVESAKVGEAETSGPVEADADSFAFAKATMSGRSYYLSVDGYYDVMEAASEYMVREEEFEPEYEEVEVPVEGAPSSEEEEKQTSEPSPPEKDSRAPWDSWSEEEWAAYSEWAGSWDPDDTQRALLEYYSAVEIYAYYFTGGYSIAEGEYRDYWEKKNGGGAEEEEEPEEEAPTEMETILALKETHAKVRMCIELDSMFDRESVFYVPLDRAEDFREELLAASEGLDRKSETRNPERYKPGSYGVEFGVAYSPECMSEHLADYYEVDKSTASAMAKELKAASGGELPENDVRMYAFRFSTFDASSGECKDYRFCVPYADGARIAEKYLGATTIEILLSYEGEAEDSESPAEDDGAVG